MNQTQNQPIKMPDLFACAPAVYAVDHEYQIFVPVTHESVMWVKVGEKNYYDDSNGVLRSKSSTHKMIVPMKALDAAKKYTLCWRIVNERKPYCSDLSDVFTAEFSFRPVRGPNVRIYQVADAHNRTTGPINAGTFFGDKLDLLLLNGDVPEDSGRIENFRTIHQIAGDITGGQIPTVFSRGNHDCRGIFAEQLAEHTACCNGNFYYTFRIGPLWGILLDCGEDKWDNHIEYGHANCCEDFRQRETLFLKQVIKNAEKEYKAPGVKYKIVLSHVPFPQTLPEPFDIEQDTYTLWCKLLKRHIKPDLMISGHIHDCYMIYPGGENDDKGTPCPVAVMSKPIKNEEFRGGAFTFTPKKITIQTTNDKHEVLATYTLPLSSK